MRITDDTMHEGLCGSEVANPYKFSLLFWAMRTNKGKYKWFYNTIHSHYYNIMIKWMLLPFGGEEKWREKMIEPIIFTDNEKILEMCCGTGGATLYISKKAGNTCEITGMDLSSGQLKYAHTRTYFCNTQFVEGDVTDTQFDDCSFDKVIITHAIHEMPRELRLKTLREAKRVLKDNKEVIVLELDNPPNTFLRSFVTFWFFYWLPFNFETPTRKDMLNRGLVNEVREAGFKNVEKYTICKGVFQTVVGTK